MKDVELQNSLCEKQIALRHINLSNLFIKFYMTWSFEVTKWGKIFSGNENKRCKVYKNENRVEETSIPVTDRWRCRRGATGSLSANSGSEKTKKPSSTKDQQKTHSGWRVSTHEHFVTQISQRSSSIPWRLGLLEPYPFRTVSDKASARSDYFLNTPLPVQDLWKMSYWHRTSPDIQSNSGTWRKSDLPPLLSTLDTRSTKRTHDVEFVSTIMFLFRVREVSGSNLSLDTGYPGFFVIFFSHSRQKLE